MDFLIIILIYGLIGLPIFLVFEPILKIKHNVFAPFFAAVLGFYFFNFLQLLPGLLGAPIVGETALWMKIGTIMLFYALLLLPSVRNSLFNLFDTSTKIKFHWVDYVALFVFVGLFVSLYLNIYSRYHFAYDELRIWLVNAKEIFNTGYLRTNTNVMDIHKVYNSFFTIPIVNIYEYYGEITEGKGTYITILNAVFAVALIWDRLMVKSPTIRALGLLSTLSVLISFCFFWLMFTRYIEVQLAFAVLFFAVVLISKTTHPYQLFAKSILLFIIAYVIATSKIIYFMYAAPLILGWAVYTYQDQNLSFKRKLNISGQGKILLGVFVLFVIAVLWTHAQYLSQLIEYKVYGDKIPIKSQKFSDKNVFVLIISKFWRKFDLGEYFWLSWELLKYYYVVLSCLFFALLSTKFNRNTTFITFVILSYFLIVLTGYVLVNRSLENMSFYRYITHSFFLIPLLFATLDLKVSWNKKQILIGVAAVLLVANGINYYVHVASKIKFHPIPVTGKLIEDRYKFESLYTAFLVKEIIGDDKVLVFNNAMTDQIPALLTNYFLQENVSSGELKAKENLPFVDLERIPHDYILYRSIEPEQYLQFTGINRKDFPEWVFFKKTGNLKYEEIPLKLN